MHWYEFRYIIHRILGIIPESEFFLNIPLKKLYSGLLYLHLNLQFGEMYGFYRILY